MNADVTKISNHYTNIKVDLIINRFNVDNNVIYFDMINIDYVIININSVKKYLKTPNPIVEIPNPMMEMLNPVVESLNSRIKMQNPIMEISNPVMEISNPIMETPNPLNGIKNFGYYNYFLTRTGVFGLFFSSNFLRSVSARSKRELSDS